MKQILEPFLKEQQGQKVAHNKQINPRRNLVCTNQNEKYKQNVFMKT
jgi:hypothetical protein